MSKVICDTCGTAYPDTADRCPICGSERQVDGKTESESAQESVARAENTPTRGGHFSNANVRKRNKARGVAKMKKPTKADRAGASNDVDPEQHGEPKRGLVVVAWVLLIAVLLVFAYIVVQYVVPMIGAGQAGSDTKPKDDSTVNTTLADAVPEDTSAACVGLSLSDSTITFDAVGRIWLLEATAEPADTTDVITYQSADESVATVAADGRVTAVGPGETTITVTCGNVTKECKVVCTFAEETTVPTTSETETTEPDTTETTEPESSETTEPSTSEEPTETEPPETEATEPPADDFGLFEQYDVTLVEQGESFIFETGEIYRRDIVWSTGNPDVATVENGEVTAVGPGMTVIYGEYNGQTDKCIIRCAFEVTDEDEGTADEGTTDEGTTDEGDEEDHPEWPYLYPNTDVSIAVGESFELTYVNVDGEWPSIDWSSDNSDVAVVDGDWVTGVAYGVTTIRGTYDGTEITCIVRVVN